MSREKRGAAALSLWEDDSLSRELRSVALAPWLQARGMRLAFVEKLPRTKRADLMARGGVPEETAQQLLRSYLLVHQRALLARFLDLLEIPHQDGIVDEEHELTAPPDEPLAAAVSRLREEYPGEDVEIYLRSLLATDSESWGGLAQHVDAP